MQRRRISGFNNPLQPLQAGKAGSKDPRGFISGNVPGQQWDIEQFTAAERNLYNNPPQQYSEAHANRAQPDVIARTMPTRVNFVPWTGTQIGANTPQLLIPRNEQRVSLMLLNRQVVNLNFTFGIPSVSSAGAPLGAVLLPGLQLLMEGDSIPINDVWVWETINSGHDFLAYEGVESLAGNI